MIRETDAPAERKPQNETKRVKIREHPEDRNESGVLVVAMLMQVS